MLHRSGSLPRSSALLLAGLVCVVYLQTLGHGFVWDDEAYVVNNRHVAGGPTLENLRWAVAEVHEANWHPLTWISHMLDARLFGLRPGGHHLVNLLLHATNAVLLAGLIARMTGAAWASLTVAALFAVHPLHVESVAWVAERKDLLSTLFGLLAAGAYLRRLRRPTAGGRVAEVLFFAAALLSKPMLVTLPFVLLLLDFWPLGRLGRVPRRRLLLEKAPLFLLSAASSVITWQAQSGDAVNRFFTLGARADNAALAFVGYLFKTVWPRRLAVFYPHPGGSLPSWHAVGAFLLLALLSALVVLLWRRSPYLLAGWLWFLGTLVPVIGIVQVGSQAMADRYTYLPLTGPILAGIFGARQLVAGRRRLRAAAGAAAAAAILALTAAAAAQAGHWRDVGTLFEHALHVTTGNYIAHEQLGVWYQARGESARAEEHYRAELVLQPVDALAHNNLGVILYRRERNEEAVAHFRAAARLDPVLENVQVNLARGLERQGKVAEAAEWYRKAIELHPANADAHLNLGAILVGQGRLDEAASHFAESARLDPDSADARSNLGVVLAARGRHAAAAEQFREALRLRPDDRGLRESLAEAERLARGAAFR